MKYQNNKNPKIGNKLFLFSVFIFLITSVFAQTTVYLKNGRNLKGEVVSINEKEATLSIHSGSGEMKIGLSKNEIDNIDSLSFDEFNRMRGTYLAYQESEENGFKSSFNDAVKLVEEKRKLTFLSEVASEVVSSDKMKERLNKKLKESYSDEEIEKERKLLVKLGIIDKSTSYREMILELFSQNIAGLYEPKENKMYIVKEKDITSSLSPYLPNEIVIHELVHALQDQHISLDNIEEKLKSDLMDKSLAVQSILEGEATYVSYSIIADYIKKLGGQDIPKEILESLDFEKFILESMMLMSKSLSDKFQNKAFIEYMLFPYIRGGVFIKYAFDRGGWGEVDKIYKNFPVSSEQIIHPEKYFLMRDDPLPLEKRNFRFLLEAGFKEISQDVLGEFTFYTLGNIFLDNLYAVMISSGWGNDYYYLYEKDDKMLLIIDTRWDSPLDAEEFSKGMKALMEKKYSNIVWGENKELLVGENKDNLIFIGKKGEEVVIGESEIKDELIFKKIVDVFSPKENALK